MGEVGLDVLDHWQSEKDAVVGKAQDIIKQAQQDGRGLSPEEAEQVEDLTGKAHGYDEKIYAETTNRRLMEGVQKMGERMRNEPQTVETPTARTWGDAFVASDVFKQLQAEFPTSDKWETPDVEFLGAAGDPVLESTGSNDDALGQTFVPSLKTPGLLQPQPTIADLFAQGTIDQGNSLRYPKATTRTAPAQGTTAEGAVKPGAEFAFDDVLETLSKHAAFSGASEEMFEDSTVIRDYINAQLPLMVRQNEEADFADQVYDAAGDTAVAADISGDSNGWDGIAAGIASVQINSGLNIQADGLFIHPMDWWELAVSKTGQDVYYGGGPNSPARSTPWGLRTVVSLTAPQGFPLVGAFGFGGQVWRKGGVRFAVTNGYNDYFRRDLLAIRAVVRSLLAIYYPEAFVVVDLAS